MDTPLIYSVCRPGYVGLDDLDAQFNELLKQARRVELMLHQAESHLGQAREDRDIKAKMAARFHKRLRVCRDKCAEKDAEIARLTALLAEAE